MRTTSVRTALPAVAMTAVSMVLTLAVVLMWLGEAMPWYVAVVVGLGIDGGWLATLAYDRSLAAQGDRSKTVTVIGWGFGVLATVVLIAHALGEDSPGPWLAVAWLPLAAKALWLVHGLWERSVLTSAALDTIREIQQEARDQAAVARARLRADAQTEEIRLEAVTEAGTRVARVQARTARRLAGAWSALEGAWQGDGTSRALAMMGAPDSPRWDLPVWGPVQPVPRVDTVERVTGPEEVYDQERDVAVSTRTPQVRALDSATAGEVDTEVDTGVDTEVDTPSGRLDAAAARAAIEAAWQEGLTVREAAARATRSPSYVGTVYRRLERERGPQISPGQMTVEEVAA